MFKQPEGVAPFIPKLGDYVAFEAADGTPLAGIVEHVPSDDETWFRVRASDGATYERRYFELGRTDGPTLEECKTKFDDIGLARYGLTPHDIGACANAKAPRGWYCTRVYGHEGPCAARPQVANVRTSDTTEVCWRCDREIRDGMVGVSDHITGCPGALTAKVKPGHMMTSTIQHPQPHHRPVSYTAGFTFPIATAPSKDAEAAIKRMIESHDRQELVLDSFVMTPTEACRSLLDTMRIDHDDETPARMAKALGELTSGYGEDLGAILKTFEGVDPDNGVVCVRNIPFASVCEHHVLPFTGTVTVAYLPSDRIVGLSKIPRLVRAVTRRLQVQERIGAMIADALMDHVKARGVMVVVKAQHTCMTLRGVECPGEMVTSTMRGVFHKESEHAARAEVLNLMSK